MGVIRYCMQFPRFFLTLVVAIQGSSVSLNTFRQFYHIFIFEVSTMQVPCKEAFMSKLPHKLKKTTSDDVHWQNAKKRFHLVRPHLKKMNQRSSTDVTADDNIVEEYVLLSRKVFAADPSTSELLFEDAHFYWNMLKVTAGEDYERRKALLEVLTLLRDLGMRYVSTNEKLNVKWAKYYPDSSFLRDLLKLNKSATKTEVKFFRNNELLGDAFVNVLKQSQETSLSLQKRLAKYKTFRESIISLAVDFEDVGELEISEMHSHLGPFQDYFPGFMRERPNGFSRAFLGLTLMKRYLEKIERVETFPSIVFNNAGFAFSHMCNIYSVLWRTIPYSKVRLLFTAKLSAYMDDSISKLDNAIIGCTEDTLKSAIKLNGIPPIALPPTPQDKEADSIATVQRKEVRVLLEALAYRIFYKVCFFNQQVDLGSFSDAQTLSLEDEEYAALVHSWIRAKTYTNVKMPFIIPKDQCENMAFFQAIELQKESGDPIWRDYRQTHVAQKLELEKILYDLSDDPIWKILQMDYIFRLERHLTLS